MLLGEDLLAGTDVVVVPHHGSGTSSSRPFVARIAPGIALISAGYRNRWGLPRPDIVRRWTDAGAEVLTTVRRRRSHPCAFATVLASSTSIATAIESAGSGTKSEWIERGEFSPVALYISFFLRVRLHG